MEFILDKKNVLEKYELLEYLTPHEANAIEKYNAGTTPRSDATGWENIETHLPFFIPLRFLSVVLIGNKNGQLQILWSNLVVATQDHYGRYTQKARPSPSSSMIPRNDDQLDQRNDIDKVFQTQLQEFDHRRTKRRRNHSADC